MGLGKTANTVIREKYATFSGRANRKEFWFFVLFVILVSFALFIPALVLFGIGAAMENILILSVGGILMLGYFIFSLGTIIPYIAVFVRRLHDRDMSAWWLLLAFVPLASLALIVIAALPGTDGENKFGPQPD